MQCRKKVLESVKKNIIIAQTKQKEQYDIKYAKPEVYMLGSIVLNKDFAHKRKELVGKWISDGWAHTE